MAPDTPDFGEPYRDDPPSKLGMGEQPHHADRPMEYPPQGEERPAPGGSRRMPNDYPTGYPPDPPFQAPQPPRRRTPVWVKVLGGCLAAVVLVGVVFACVAGALVAALFHSSPTTATTTQTFIMAGVPTVRIHSTAGNIHILPGDTGVVIVRAHKYAHAFSEDDAQNALRGMAVTVMQSGSTLDIQIDESGSESGVLLWGGRHVDLTVTVPAQANIAATLNAGNVDVDGVTGTIAIQNDAGNLSLDDVTLGGSSSATDNAGNIDVSGALQAGASLESQTNAGNVTARLPRATSAHLTASTNAGSVDVDAVWPVSVSQQFARGSASGDLNPHPTGSLILETNAGNVTLEAR
jgi:hypothetical protein